MNGWIIGGIVCVLYVLGVGYGAYKKSPGLIKLIKMKLSKKMSDKTAITTAWVAVGVVAVLGIVFFILGAR